MMRGPGLPVYLCVLTGLAALALHGGAIVVATGTVALVAAIPSRWREAGAEIPWALVTIPVVLGLLGMSYAGLSPQHTVALLLLYLQAQSRVARTSVADDKVSLALSALMFILAATRTDSPWFAALLLTWTIAIPVALTRIDLERTVADRPRKRDALSRLSVAPMAAPVVALALVLFAALPRFSDARAVHTIGSVMTLPFVENSTVMGVSTDGAHPGDVAELLQDPTVAFRAWFSTEIEGPAYFRVVVFDEWDGEGWSRSESKGALISDEQMPADALHIEVAQANVEGGLLMSAGRPHALRIDGTSSLLFPDADGNVPVDVQGFTRYHLWTQAPLGPGAVTGTDLGPGNASWLEFPRLDSRVIELVGSITADSTTESEKVQAIARYLRSNYHYTRSPGASAGRPLDWFLFDGQKGHCEYFATSMVLMARAAGVPARYVSGYVGGESNASGYRVYRMSHAHAWAEVLIKDEGWVLVDATPAGPAAPVTELSVAEEGVDALTAWWYRTLLGYDVGTQTDAVFVAAHSVESWLPAAGTLEGSRPWAGLFGLLLIVGGLLVGGRRLLLRTAARLAGEIVKARPTGKVARAHSDARDALASLGWSVPASLPPVAAARWVHKRETGESATALIELAWLHYNVRYGGADDNELGPAARDLVVIIREIGPPPF